MDTKSYLTRSPNPLFARKNFLLLDGTWSFCFDPNDVGLRDGWFKAFPSEHLNIRVPYVYQAKNGLNIKTQEKDIVWYSKTIEISQLTDRVDLVILACDHKLKLYVNGIFLSSHEGGYDQIRVDIARAMKIGKNTITIRVEDSKSEDQLRGKQFIGDKPSKIYYEGITGIYRSVYLEFLSKTNIQNIKLVPSYLGRSLKFNAEINNGIHAALKIDISKEGKLIKTEKHSIKGKNVDDEIIFDCVDGWSNRNPSLYDVVLSIVDNDGKILDEVYTYVGFVSYEAKNGKFYVNGIDTYIKSVLFQGYYGNNLYTGTEKEYLDDLIKIKECGFNSLRIHQMIEDPLFMYHCDRLGIYTTLETPSPFEMSDHLKKQYVLETDNIVNNNYNHPSIYVLILFNESWGIRDILDNAETKKFVTNCYERYKRMRPQWLICSNDGWEHTISDICTIHNYEPNASNLAAFMNGMHNELKTKNNCRVNGANYIAFVDNHKYDDQPIFLSEFGGYGLSISKENTDNFFYGEAANTNDFATRIKEMYMTIKQFQFIRGICYTQYNDTFQETNGIVTENRQLKIPAEFLKDLNDMLR